MARDTLTGTRIRERRAMVGMKQSSLAKEVDISPSYLNLIEHNRRRIGGKLLIDIAAALGVEPASLAEGAETALLASLRQAASGTDLPPEELARVDEFAGRFPGWAALLTGGQRKIETLQQSIEALTDRLAHDPHLAASLHEMLSTVTAIRSAASILAEPGHIEPDWQRRFNRNIYEDSARLADTSRSLAQYLEAAEPDAAETSSPQDEMDAVFQGKGYHLPLLEGESPDVGAATETMSLGMSQAAQWLLHRAFVRYRSDAQKLPLELCARVVERRGVDPFVLADAADCDIGAAIRRLAHLPESITPRPLGLVMCDGSGVTTFRKPLPEFSLPRLGAGCALWPLYRALTRPLMVIEEHVEQTTRVSSHHRTIAVAQPSSQPRAGHDVLFESQMLIIPEPKTDIGRSAQQVGLSCRICPHESCVARREPSIITGS